MPVLLSANRKCCHSERAFRLAGFAGRRARNLAVACERRDLNHERLVARRAKPRDSSLRGGGPSHGGPEGKEPPLRLRMAAISFSACLRNAHEWRAAERTRGIAQHGVGVSVVCAILVLVATRERGTPLGRQQPARPFNRPRHVRHNFRRELHEFATRPLQREAVLVLAARRIRPQRRDAAPVLDLERIGQPRARRTIRFRRRPSVRCANDPAARTSVLRAVRRLRARVLRRRCGPAICRRSTSGDSNPTRRGSCCVRSDSRRPRDAARAWPSRACSAFRE